MVDELIDAHGDLLPPGIRVGLERGGQTVVTRTPAS